MINMVECCFPLLLSTYHAVIKMFFASVKTKSDLNRLMLTKRFVVDLVMCTVWRWVLLRIFFATICDAFWISIPHKQELSCCNFFLWDTWLSF